MTDRPMIFSAPMVRALLDGRKTQTRRVLKPQPYVPRHCSACGLHRGEWMACEEPECGTLVESPPDQSVSPYAVGDRLWVRETHYLTDDGHEDFAVFAADEDDVREHLAGIDALPATLLHEVRARHRRLRAPIHLPRWASRLTLHVVDVRVQRLQGIGENDAVAEGVRQDRHGAGTFVGREGPGRWVTPWLTAREAFEDIWASIHGPGTWSANPWVVALTFTVERVNIDAAASET